MSSPDFDVLAAEADLDAARSRSAAGQHLDDADGHQSRADAFRRAAGGDPAAGKDAGNGKAGGDGGTGGGDGGDGGKAGDGGGDDKGGDGGKGGTDAAKPKGDPVKGAPGLLKATTAEMKAN